MGNIEKINKLLVNGQIFCLATVIESDTTDIAPGSKVIVRADGTMEGSIGSQNLDLAIRDRALAALPEEELSRFLT